MPLSILAALYMAFFAPKWIREKIKPVIELMAGFPSVVIGFFCLMTVATVVQALFDVKFRLNSVVGGIGLAMAVIPIVYRPQVRATSFKLHVSASGWDSDFWELHNWYKDA